MHMSKTLVSKNNLDINTLNLPKYYCFNINIAKQKIENYSTLKLYLKIINKLGYL